MSAGMALVQVDSPTAQRALTTRPSRTGNGRSARTAMKVESRDALLTAIARGWIDDIRCASPCGNLGF